MHEMGAHSAGRAAEGDLPVTDRLDTGTRERWLLMNRDLAVAATLLLLRIAVGLIFLQAGGMKLLGWFGGMPPDGSTARLWTQVWFGGVLEVFGGILIILGLFTRPVAFILSGEMAVAYWQFHAPGGFWPIQNHGEPAVLCCFIYLFLAAYGAGEWSLDAALARRLIIRKVATQNAP